MKRYTAGPNDAGTRLSRFVQKVTHGLPDAVMHKSFRNRRVKVNGRRAQPAYRLAEGDEIELYLNDAYFAAGARRPPPAAESLPAYETVYHDGGIAVLYKPAGVLSHRDAGGAPGLLDAFAAALAESGEYRPEQENAFAPALCNRLDRGTEGLVVAAKTAQALRGMNTVIRLGLVQKTYLCVCAGRPPQGVFHAYLARDKAARHTAVTAGPAPGAKPIITEIRLLDTCRELCLCQIELHTGRTHQIRAHLAFMGAPLLGDRKYGAPPAAAAPSGPALCAWRLRFAPRLPEACGLGHLAGRTFTAGRAALPAWWRQLAGRDVPV